MPGIESVAFFTDICCLGGNVINVLHVYPYLLCATSTLQPEVFGWRCRVGGALRDRDTWNPRHVLMRNEAPSRE